MEGSEGRSFWLPGKLRRRKPLAEEGRKKSGPLPSHSLLSTASFKREMVYSLQAMRKGGGGASKEV